MVLDELMEEIRVKALYAGAIVGIVGGIGLFGFACYSAAQPNRPEPRPNTVIAGTVVKEDRTKAGFFRSESYSFTVETEKGDQTFNIRGEKGRNLDYFINPKGKIKFEASHERSVSEVPVFSAYHTIRLLELDGRKVGNHLLLPRVLE